MEKRIKVNSWRVWAKCYLLLKGTKTWRYYLVGKNSPFLRLLKGKYRLITTNVRIWTDTTEDLSWPSIQPNKELMYARYGSQYKHLYLGFLVTGRAVTEPRRLLADFWAQERRPTTPPRDTDKKHEVLTDCLIYNIESLNLLKWLPSRLVSCPIKSLELSWYKWGRFVSRSLSISCDFLLLLVLPYRASSIYENMSGVNCSKNCACVEVELSIFAQGVA
jgi:hypothetical protein